MLGRGFYPQVHAYPGHTDRWGRWGNNGGAAYFCMDNLRAVRRPHSNRRPSASGPLVAGPRVAAPRAHASTLKSAGLPLR